MKLFLIFRWSLFSLIFCFFSSAHTKQLETFDGPDGNTFLSWNSLVDTSIKVENPFENMPYQQLENMKDFAALKRLLEGNTSVYSKAELTDYQVRKASITKQLEAAGLNAEALYEARNNIIKAQYEQMRRPNPHVINKEWKIPGFMAPIEFNGTKVTRFFLVPTAGACIHTPSPPPNQIILVEYDKGVEIQKLEDAFWVQGTLMSDAVTDLANYYDGKSVVDAIYTMKAETFHFFQ